MDNVDPSDISTSGHRGRTDNVRTADTRDATPNAVLNLDVGLNQDDYRILVIKELSRLEEDLLYTEKTHFVASEELKTVHLVVGLVATTSAAASAVAVVASQSGWISGSLALTAAVTSALLTFLKADEKSAQHLATARSLGEIRVQARQYREIDIAGGEVVERSVMRTFVDTIATAKARVDGASPSLSERRFGKARRKIEAGDFTHESTSRSGDHEPQR